MTSTQFVNQITARARKAKAIAAKPGPQLESTAEMSQVNDQRKAVVARIAHLVAWLDSVQTQSRQHACPPAALSEGFGVGRAGLPAYEKSVADRGQRPSVSGRRFQTVIDSQTVRIASLGQVGRHAH